MVGSSWFPTPSEVTSFESSMRVSRRQQNVETMKKDREENTVSEMRPEYDFSSGVRGKYASRFPEGSSVIILDPDVAEVFEDSEAVNRALRTLVHSTKKKRKKKGPTQKEPSR